MTEETHKFYSVPEHELREAVRDYVNSRLNGERVVAVVFHRDGDPYEGVPWVYEAEVVVEDVEVEVSTEEDGVREVKAA